MWQPLRKADSSRGVTILALDSACFRIAFAGHGFAHGMGAGGSIVHHGMGFHHSIVGVGHFGGGGFGHGMVGGFGHGGGGGHR